MSRSLLSLALLAAIALPASAAGWSSFEGAFSAWPCQDGWTACLVGDTAAGPGALRDAAGRPLPSDARIGWFDLQPTAHLSPFVKLSAYSGPVGGQVAEAPPTPPPRPVASNDPPPSRPSDPPPETTSGASTRPSASPTSSSPTSTTSTPTSTSSTASTSPTSSGTQPTSTSGGMRPGSPSSTAPVASTTTTTTTSGGMRPGSPSSTTTTSTTTTTTSSPAPTSSTAMPTSSTPPSTPTQAVVAPVSSGPQDDSCDDLVKLEPSAMMGALRVGQAKCLEARIGTEAQQTTKDKLSRLLISNAENKGDKAEWERLVKRHLEDIDRSDPDLCFKYALQLSRGGVGRAQGVIRWADYALENKARWSGTTYKTRVFGLYKLRAEAANKLWQDAEKTYMETDHTDENEAKAAKFRGQAKDYAREWLDYAKVSEQDTKTAMALCVSAAGNRAFCEGG